MTEPVTKTTFLGPNEPITVRELLDDGPSDLPDVDELLAACRALRTSDDPA